MPATAKKRAKQALKRGVLTHNGARISDDVRRFEVVHLRSMVPASLQPVKIEQREGQKTPTIVGYGAVFYRADQPGTEYWLFSDYVERVGRGAFDRAIKEDDVRGLFNHDVNQILGRTIAKPTPTMRLSIDDIGLKYEIDLPDSPDGQNMKSRLERGDVTGSSFSFDIVSVQMRQEEDYFVRELTDVKLYDVGPVVFPAYTNATAGIRQEFKPGITRVHKRSESFDDRSEARRELREWLRSLGPTLDQVEVDVALAKARCRR